MELLDTDCHVLLKIVVKYSSQENSLLKTFPFVTYTQVRTYIYMYIYIYNHISLLFNHLTDCMEVNSVR